MINYYTHLNEKLERFKQSRLVNPDEFEKLYDENQLIILNRGENILDQPEPILS